MLLNRLPIVLAYGIIVFVIVRVWGLEWVALSAENHLANISRGEVLFTLIILAVLSVANLAIGKHVGMACVMLLVISLWWNSGVTDEARAIVIPLCISLIPPGLTYLYRGLVYGAWSEW